MKKPSFHSLIKQELVNRFEDVIKNEINEFMTVQSNNEKSFTELRLYIQEIRQNIKHILDDVSKDSEKFVEKVNNEKNEFLKILSEQSKYISNKIKDADIYSQEFDVIKANAINKSQIRTVEDCFKSDIESLKVMLHDLEVKMNEAVVDSSNELEIRINEILIEQERNNNNTNISIVEFYDRIKDYENYVEGYKKELDAIKKKAFIQEKYIEKIMTDLENMNNEAKK